MQIGKENFPDECPKCGEVKGWIRKPGLRIIPEFGKSFSCFSLICLRCKYETKTVKIRKDYLKEKTTEIKDITPYKSNILNKIISKIKKWKKN